MKCLFCELFIAGIASKTEICVDFQYIRMVSREEVKRRNDSLKIATIFT